MPEDDNTNDLFDDPERLIDPLEDDDLATPFQYAITSYGADYPVDGLISRLQSGSLFIPDFQRDYVWTHKQASQFIESLLLGIPVPGIFLAKDPASSKLIVVDGQQRLRTLQYFQEGRFPKTDKKFKLVGVQAQYDGLTYDELDPDDRIRLNDCLIHATIVKQDQPSDDQSSIYYIFERINTKGLSLSAQEIRACIYSGPFSDHLKLMNSDEHWRSIYGRPSSRLRDQELILRFFALYYAKDSYTRPMRDFLNRFMGKHRDATTLQLDDMTNLFKTTVKAIDIAISRPFRVSNAINAAVADAVFVGLSTRLRSGPSINSDQILDKYNHLISNTTFRTNTERATADEDSVNSRIDLAIEVYAK